MSALEEFSVYTDQTGKHALCVKFEIYREKPANFQEFWIFSSLLVVEFLKQKEWTRSIAHTVYLILAHETRAQAWGFSSLVCKDVWDMTR